jgi:hypothetical protein
MGRRPAAADSWRKIAISLIDLACGGFECNRLISSAINHSIQPFGTWQFGNLDVGSDRLK